MAEFRNKNESRQGKNCGLFNSGGGATFFETRCNLCCVGNTRVAKHNQIKDTMMVYYSSILNCRTYQT